MSMRNKILNHLRTGRAITPLVAMQQYGSMRLSAVIYDLRKAGYDIKTKMKKDARGITYGEYRLVGGPL